METLVSISALAVGALLTAMFLARFGALVQPWQTALVLRLGRVARRLGPGLHWLWPFETVRCFDRRSQMVTVPAQELLTKEGFALKVTLLASYALEDAEKALLASQSFEDALYARLQVALRAEISRLTAEEVLEQRPRIGERIRETVIASAAALGLKLELVELKDVMFPGELKKVFAEVVRAQKEGQAALERARGEAASLRSLANTARLLEEHPQLFQLRLLQAQGNTLVVGTNLVPLKGKDS